MEAGVLPAAFVSVKKEWNEEYEGLRWLAHKEVNQGEKYVNTFTGECEVRQII